MMCRYAMNSYKSHYACFECRKTFKAPIIEDWLAASGREYVFRQLWLLGSYPPSLRQREAELGHRLSDLIAEYSAARHDCPECKRPMCDMGRDLKAPRQSDVRAWKALAGLYRMGHVFHSCGCDGPGWIPQSISDYHDYLVQRRDQYASELKRTRNSEEMAREHRLEVAGYWSERLERIDAELATKFA